MDVAQHETGDVDRGSRWIAGPGGPLMSWWSAPSSGAPRSGVLVLPPVGYQWWTTHRTLRVLTERLAAAGHLVLRLDYDGTGDSAGDQWDTERLAAWRASAAAAADELRSAGCQTIGLVGARLGATLALIDGPALGADAIVTWAPVTSARRWTREIRMLAEPVPEPCDPHGQGTLVNAGTVFSEDTLAAIGRLSVTDAVAAPAPRVLTIDARPDAKLGEHLGQLGCSVDTRAIEAAATLDVSAEQAQVAEDVIAEITSWLGPAGVAGGATIRQRWRPAPARLPWRGGTLTEEVGRLGPTELTAIKTTPTDDRPRASTLVFLNTGSEPHVGPGRAWVEIARDLALDGHVCLRADWRGWGESPDDGFAPGRPYDPHVVDETVDLVQALRHDGHDHIVLVGQCASAWVALRAILQTTVAGVVAINPQMYYMPGDPVDATPAETRRRRRQEIADIQAGATAGRWDAEDRAGDRPWAAQWLDELVATRIPTTMLFGADDDGLEFLQTRHGRRLAHAKAAGLVVREMADIDHSLHRAWTRSTIAEAIARAVRTSSDTTRAA